MDAPRLRFHLITQLLHRDAQAAALLRHAHRGARGCSVRVTRRDCALELEHLAGARGRALAPQGPARMYLQAPAALEELRIDALDVEYAASAVEIGEIARAQLLPAAL